MKRSLCETCTNVRPVVTPRGSRFLLCLLSTTDAAFPKYPRQPVVQCAGRVPALREEAPDQSPDPEQTADERSRRGTA